MKVEFYKHNLNKEDFSRVENVLQGLFLTTGKEVKTFEKEFSSYLGVNRSLGVSSCTGALHLSLLATGIKPGNEVITTPMTFIATASAIMYVGAIPVFVDIDPTTGLIDTEKIEKAITPKTRAIIPVHLFGQMCDMVSIRKIADKHNLIVIEDCAHALESKREGIRPGQLSHTACFSFYATKNITSGEGGAVATNSEELAKQISLLRLHGMSSGADDRYRIKYQHWDMETLGWKYNMTNIQAAMLIGQLSRSESLLSKREEIAQKYEKAFFDVEGLTFPKTYSNAKNARHIFAIMVNPTKRDEILNLLQDAGIGVAVNFRAIHLLKYLKKKFNFTRGSFPIAEHLGDSIISIPLYPKLTDEEVGYIIQEVKKAVGRYRVSRNILH